MSRRTSRITLIAALALLAIPAGAMADPTATSNLSVVDAVSTDVAIDGGSESTSSASKAAASDSPAKDSYNQTPTPVPPPVDCSAPSTTTTDSSSSSSSSSSSNSSGSGSTSTTTCVPIVECSAADTDGKKANGEPCVATSTECTEGTATTVGGTVCGGGATEETPEATPAEPVDGGGAPETEPVDAVGGGGPELPFTGLPLWYAIYAGLALMFGGVAMWLRHRTAGPRD